jgi:hypothetical protein
VQLGDARRGTRPAETRSLTPARETVEEPVDLVLGVVVHDARPHGAVLEAEVLHRLDGVVVAVPDRDLALCEERATLSGE